MVSRNKLNIITYHTFSKKTLALSFIYSKWKNYDEKVLKEELKSIEILEILGLIENI